MAPKDREASKPKRRKVLQSYHFMMKPREKIGQVICDESHVIKNPNSQSADAIVRLGTTVFWGLSATPMVNRVADMLGYLVQMAGGESMLLNVLQDESLTSIYLLDFHALSGTVPGDDEESLPFGNILPDRPTEWFGKPAAALKELFMDIDANIPM